MKCAPYGVRRTRNGTVAVPYIEEMEDVMDEIKLTDAQLEEALRCCAKSEESACKKCPMGVREADGKCCFDALRLMAALRLEELAEENRRMRDATEDIVKALAERMVQLARERNTARERGLPKANGDYVLVLNQIQEKLVALGRSSVVAAEPVDGGWWVTGITVEGREVFGEVGGDSAENG